MPEYYPNSQILLLLHILGTKTCNASSQMDILKQIPKSVSYLLNPCLLHLLLLQILGTETCDGSCQMDILNKFKDVGDFLFILFNLHIRIISVKSMFVLFKQHWPTCASGIFECFLTMEQKSVGIQTNWNLSERTRSVVNFFLNLGILKILRMKVYIPNQ